MIVVSSSICPLCIQKVSETIWPQDTRGCISGHWALEGRTVNSNHITLATGMNTSFLDRPYKKIGDNGHLYVLGGSSGKNCTVNFLNYRGYPEPKPCHNSMQKFGVPLMPLDLVVSCLHISHRRDCEQTNEFLCQLIDSATCSSRI